MIQAERNELETHLQRSTVAIRERELATFTENFAVLSTQSVFLTGLGFGGITMTPIWDPEDRVLTQCFFYTACACAIGFNVLTMCITSWSMIFGPGLGIRGPRGSMSRAVKGMYAERKLAIRFYLAGLVSMCCAAVALGWLKYGCLICGETNDDAAVNYLTDGVGCHSTADWTLICYRVPIIITLIFFGFMVFTVTHMAYVTRPRFTFKDGTGKSRRPEDAFTVGGAFDAENQEAVQNVLAQQAANDAPEAPGMDKKREAVGRQIKQIEALEKDGTLSAAQAAEEKKAVIARFMDEVVEEPMPSTGGAKGGSFLSAGFGSTMRKRVSQSFTSSKSSSMSFNGNIKADNSHFDAPAEVEIKKGMLTMDKQVVYATLSNIKLLLASPKGEVVSENTMFGKKIKARIEHISPESFVISVDGDNYKLKAQSATEAKEWVEAVHANF